MYREPVALFDDDAGVPEVDAQRGRLAGLHHCDVLGAAPVAIAGALDAVEDQRLVAVGVPLARVGGLKHPQQIERFEAYAVHRGADEKPFTEDDVDLFQVRPRWGLEEFRVRENDDDLITIDGLTTSKLKVDAGNGDDTFGLTGAIVDRIHLDMGRGDDSASVATTTTERLKVDLGIGDDDLTIAATVDIALSLAMDGGRGIDTLTNGLPANEPLDLVRIGFESLL